MTEKKAPLLMPKMVDIDYREDQDRSDTYVCEGPVMRPVPEDEVSIPVNGVIRHTRTSFAYAKKHPDNVVWVCPQCADCDQAETYFCEDQWARCEICERGEIPYRRIC